MPCKMTDRPRITAADLPTAERWQSTFTVESKLVVLGGEREMKNTMTWSTGEARIKGTRYQENLDRNSNREWQIGSR